MARYRLVFRKSVAKDFRSIPKKDAVRLLKRIDALADDPRPAGCEKLTDQHRYRIRQSNYRILYEIQDDMLVVIVVKVGARGAVYK